MIPVILSLGGPAAVISYDHAPNCASLKRRRNRERRRCDCGAPTALITEDPEIIRRAARAIWSNSSNMPVEDRGFVSADNKESTS